MCMLLLTSSPLSLPPPPQAQKDDKTDANADACVLCGIGGSLVCCDACPAAYHMRCVGESSRAIGGSEWFCPECRVGGRGEATCQPACREPRTCRSALPISRY